MTFCLAAKSHAWRLLFSERQVGKVKINLEAMAFAPWIYMRSDGVLRGVACWVGAFVGFGCGGSRPDYPCSDRWADAELARRSLGWVVKILL